MNSRTSNRCLISKTYLKYMEATINVLPNIPRGIINIGIYCQINNP